MEAQTGGAVNKFTKEERDKLRQAGHTLLAVGLGFPVVDVDKMMGYSKLGNGHHSHDFAERVLKDIEHRPGLNGTIDRQGRRTDDLPAVQPTRLDLGL
jgi:hypothetical protein